MTKIQIDDGEKKTEKKKTAKSSKTIKVTKATNAKTTKVAKIAKTAKAAKPTKSAKAAKDPKKIIVTEAGSIHSSVQKSTTLSRKYVKKPMVITVTEESPKPVVVTETPKPVVVAEAPKPVKAEAPEPVVVAEAPKPVKAEPVKAETPKAEKKLKATIASKLAKKRAEAEREQAARAARIARERAEKAAKKALKATPKFKKSDRAIMSASAVITNIQKKEQSEKPATPKMAHEFKKKGRAGRIFLALICSGATVAALVAFVHFSIPDLSVRVAAIQTGIDATYPSFVPRGYTLSNVTSDKEGVVVMTFSGPDGAYFTMSEEKSTWDSTALLNNYVKKNYPNDFTTLREQGITIYVRGEKASWVNGGLLYKIDATGKYLTKEQIRNIATSL